MKQRRLTKIFSVLAAACIAVGMCAMSANAATGVSTKAELVAAVSRGEDIELLSDIPLDSCLKVEKAVTLDLNGYTLSRSLSAADANGHVIEVTSNGSLTLKDSSAGKDGTVSGGVATNGGGIYNGGTLKTEGGNISGNTASANGGGIYCASGSHTEINNTTVKNNKANNGGGISVPNGATATLTDSLVKGNTALYNGGGIEDLGGVTLKSASVISNNAYETGSGIYLNYAYLRVEGKTVVKSNNKSDVYLKGNKKIEFSGKLEQGANIGVTGDYSNTEITYGYSKYHSEEPGNYFFTNTDDGSVVWNDGKTEAKALNGYSVVEVYDANNKLTKSETLLNPDSAWDKAVSYASDKNNVVLKLGSNYSHDRCLELSSSKKLTVDLNGYYILRTRNGDDVSNGGVFKVESGATLTVMDSRPESRCYDGIRGGVITGGCSSDDGAGFYVGKNASLYIEGGTVYNCYSTGDGGGIYASYEADTVSVKNARIFSCEADGTYSNGGAMSILCKNCYISDSEIDCCWANNNAGAIQYKPDNTTGNRSFILTDVVFSNNHCEDIAGALLIDDFTNKNETEISLTNCYFLSNRSDTDDGGAVYIDDNDETYTHATLFKNCCFNKNIAGDEGGAMFVNDNNAVVADCTFEENSSKNSGGAIYVDSYYDLGVKGSVIIRNNNSEKTRHNNLCLQEGAASTARLYSGGLYDDAYISVSTTDDETDFARNIVEYQQKYFHAENGKIEFT